MDPLITGALITGGLGAIGNIFGASKQSQNVAKTNKANMELAKFQFQKNKEMWHLMNRYNTPKAQMARFQEAGLNPNLMYGMGTPGNVGTYPQYQAPNLDYRGRPSLAGAALSGGLQGAYQGIQEYQKMDHMRETIKQAQINTWLANETKGFKRESEKIRVAREKIETRIKEIKKGFWEKGISPADATYIRIGVQALNALGVKVEGILDNLPDVMIKQIFQGADLPFLGNTKNQKKR